MRTLLLALLTVGFALPGLVTSGCYDDCDCDPVDAFFEVNGIWDIRHVIAYGDDRGTVDAAAFDRVRFSEYALTQVFYEVSFVASAPTPTARGRRPGLSFLPSAYACSCIPPGTAGAKDQTVTSYTVRTLYDFDGDHPAGSDITEFYGPYYDLIPVDTIRDPQLDLKALVAPSASDTFQVQVAVELSDGQVFEGETVPIVFVQ